MLIMKLVFCCTSCWYTRAVYSHAGLHCGAAAVRFGPCSRRLMISMTLAFLVLYFILPFLAGYNKP
ncbi:hypothetical protein [Deinococcus cavernae]|uniref:hypothetical protein n=1 Tax=Deinococcus cavernae TaxID=2320857 RepID=UPI001F46FE6A|nr:hypothetical protein [Deinococcus cavernae]